MITPDTPIQYSVERLLTIFIQARDARLARVNELKIGQQDGMGNWAANWPGGNARVEQACVDALQAWKDAGVKTVESDYILSDADPLNPTKPDVNTGNIHTSFFMQLKNNQIKPV